MDEKSTLNIEETKILQQKLQDHFSVSTVAHTVSIALGFLDIPRDERLGREIKVFVRKTGNIILSETGSETIPFTPTSIKETSLNQEQLIEKQLQKLERSFEDTTKIASVIRSISGSLETLNISPEILPENHIKHFLEEQRRRVAFLLQQQLYSFRGVLRAMPEDLEEEYFHIDSSNWKIKELRDGTKIKIHPDEDDIIEIDGGEFKGEQRFTQEAALRETRNKGMEIPSNEDWKNIMYWISPEIEFSDKSQEDTRIRTMLNLKLSGASQLGAEDPMRWKGERGHCWSSTEGGYYITVTSSRIEPIRSIIWPYFNPVRCLKKSFSQTKKDMAELQKKQNT